MKTCLRCNSDRILSISGKCSDCYNYTFQEKSGFGYVPRNLNVGGGDYIKFDLCLECGQVQDKFPVSESGVRAFQ